METRSSPFFAAAEAPGIVRSVIRGSKGVPLSDPSRPVPPWQRSGMDDSGQPCGRVREMEVATRVVFERCPNLQLVDLESVEISGAVLRGPSSLPVTFDEV